MRVKILVCLLVATLSTGMGALCGKVICDCETMDCENGHCCSEGGGEEETDSCCSEEGTDDADSCEETESKTCAACGAPVGECTEDCDGACCQD